jgi:hypothetical protein
MRNKHIIATYSLYLLLEICHQVALKGSSRYTFFSGEPQSENRCPSGTEQRLGEAKVRIAGFMVPLYCSGFNDREE